MGSTLDGPDEAGGILSHRNPFWEGRGTREAGIPKLGLGWLGATTGLWLWSSKGWEVLSNGLLPEQGLVVDLCFKCYKVLMFLLPWWIGSISRQVVFIPLPDLAAHSRSLNELASWVCLMAGNCQIMALLTLPGGELVVSEAWDPNWWREAPLKRVNKRGLPFPSQLKARDLGKSWSLSHWWASFCLSWGFLSVFVSFLEPGILWELTDFVNW